ncbi:MAG: hypothetical protein Tsb0014_06820 [Pleurocapsa sp.]
MIRILLVDDQNLVQQGIKALLDQDSNFKVIGTVKDGRSAVEQTDLLNPDIVLIDIEMPDMDGITATKYITHLAPKTKVIILTSYEDKKYVMQALLAGAKGYILKSSLMTDLKQAILAVNNGYSQVESRLLAKIFSPNNFKPRKTESLSNQKSQEIKSPAIQSKQSSQITENPTVIKPGEDLESEPDRGRNEFKLNNKNSQLIVSSAEVGDANDSSIIEQDREPSNELKRHQQNIKKRANSVVNQASLAPIFDDSSLPQKLPSLKQNKVKNRLITKYKKLVKLYLKKINNNQIISRYKSRIFEIFQTMQSLDKSQISRAIKQWHQQGYFLKIALVTFGLILFLILHNL